MKKGKAMEISDVLAALEELKNGIAAVKSANENVERAANAARMVCEAFGECSSKLDGFSTTVMDPIRGKVDEITVASAQMVRNCAESVDGLRVETKNIVDVFNGTISKSCDRIQSDITEFHREIESFETKLSRVASRVEEKTDDAVAEVRKQSKAVHEEIEGFKASQEEALGKVSANVAESSAELKEVIKTGAEGLGKAIAKETKGLSEEATASKKEILAGVSKVKTIAVLALIAALAAAAGVTFLVVRSLGA